MCRVTFAAELQVGPGLGCRFAAACTLSLGRACIGHGNNMLGTLATVDVGFWLGRIEKRKRQ